jgi:DNA-directed RNA polymerase subunit RPC12/RpoP
MGLWHEVTLSQTKMISYGCIHCSTRFSAKTRVVGVGSAREPVLFGSGEAKADERAELDLIRELNQVRPVRCPGCDRFKLDMYRPARMSVAVPATLAVAALGVLATLALMFLGTGPFWGDERVWFAVPAAFGMVALLTYALLMTLLDPNAPIVRQRFPVGVRISEARA